MYLSQRGPRITYCSLLPPTLDDTSPDAPPSYNMAAQYEQYQPTASSTPSAAPGEAATDPPPYSSTAVDGDNSRGNEQYTASSEL